MKAVHRNRLVEMQKINRVQKIKVKLEKRLNYLTLALLINVHW